MFSEFFFGIMYFFEEHRLLSSLVGIVAILLMFAIMGNGNRLIRTLLALITTPLLMVIASVSYAETINALGGNIYSIDFIAEKVESDYMTEEQAKKYLLIIASHNEKEREKWLQKKKKEGEEKNKQIERRIKTEEIKKRLEDEYKNIVGGDKQ